MTNPYRNRKVIAAIMVAVQAYLDEEAQPSTQRSNKLNAWKTACRPSQITAGKSSWVGRN